MSILQQMKYCPLNSPLQVSILSERNGYSIQAYLTFGKYAVYTVECLNNYIGSANDIVY
jgi:hypothetical protein